MKITFIRPSMSNFKGTDTLQPLVFAILSGLTPPDIETVIYDERIEDIPYDEPSDLVAMTVETFTARKAYQIATEYKKRKVPVIMGGFHPSMVPEESLRYATSIIIGDAEGIWEKVLEDFKENKLKRIYKSSSLSQSQILKTKLNRNIFKGKNYPAIELVQWGRGCPHDCDFCSIKAFYGKTQRQRPIDDVVQEIAELKNKQIFFVDDNIFHGKKCTKDFLEAISSLNIKWTCQISIDVTKDKKIMKQLEKSGCNSAVIGFETLDIRNLTQMKKRWNVANDGYDTAIQIIKDHGIMIYGTFVFGYDHDTPDSIKACLEFALRWKFFLANFNPLTPTPGTPLYLRLLREKRFIHEKWWLDPTYIYGRAIFKPKNMTPKELELECFDAKKSFNTYGSILKRALNPKVNFRSFNNLSLYFLANIINRREMLKKQGMRLGM